MICFTTEKSGQLHTELPAFCCQQTGYLVSSFNVTVTE